METVEMPMTSGVTVATTSFDEAEINTVPVTTNDSEAVFEIASDSPRNDEMRTESHTIDTLLENAQKNGEGFEDILEKIADGEFEDEEVSSEIEVQEAELQEDEEFEDEMITHEEFVILEEKVDTLIDTTKVIADKLDQLPQEIRMNAKDFFDMIILMYKFAKEEKSKKKKGSMFLFLIKLVGTFMQSIADPEALEKLEPKEYKEQEEEETDERNVVKMMEYLQKNGMLTAA